MNNEELVELERLSRTAPKSVDAFLDIIAKRYLGLVGRQGSFKPAHPVVMSLSTLLRARGSDAPHKRLDDLEGSKVAVGELLAIAGLTERAERMRKLWERGQPLFKRDETPAAAGGTPQAWPEKDPKQEVPAALSVALRSTEQIDNQVEQVCACVHLLSNAPFQRVDSLQWVRRVAQERLSELLMAQPALLHPRLFFEVVGWGSKVPLAHALAMRTRGRLPSGLDGYSDAQLTPFATHPIVVAALSQKAPVVPGNPKDSQGEGRTLLGVFTESNPMQVTSRMLSSVLQLERLRKAAGVRARSAIPNGSSQKETFLPRAATLFAWAWKDGDYRASMQLLRELRESGLVDERAFRFQVLLDAPQALGQMSTTPGFRKQIDVVGRLVRQTEALQLIGFPGAKSPAGAATLILKASFACANDPGYPTVSTAASMCDVNDAARALSFFEAQGIGFEDMAERIRTSGATNAGWEPSDPWATALRVMEAERSMARVIKETVAGEAITSASNGPGEANPAPRRRRAPV
ncbi:hypothetical protein [Methylibium petroleiphilum]|uniref:Uncharacterized protein n=1 Tax=Methylibium petroleiphilum (strain ATCC BAA-1232 / LMG 22953 / PM1) TaxID=420662 RepID=A2SMJ4_METPP|nr:hypothetical protein [Methylibium petroleiphilum]ABM96783.1 hypothetical protein Mpe_B0002 [Methylibium petroleiphilum PM1]